MYLNIKLIHAEHLLVKIIPFFVCVFGVFILMIQRVLHPSRAKRYMVVLDEMGNPYIADVTSLYFLRSFGIEQYKMVYRSGSTGRQLSAEIINNRNFKAIVEYLHTHQVLSFLSNKPQRGAEKVEKLTSVWKGAYYFTVSYKVAGEKKTKRARFYNDIKDYERLLEIFNVIYRSTDHKEERNKVAIGASCMVSAAILLPVTMVLSTYSTSMALNLFMLIAVITLFGTGLGILSSR